jgi:glycine cleavage system H protein
MAKKGEGIFEPIGPPLFRARVFLGTLVELPHVGEQVKKGGAVGVVESVKAASDLYSPVRGEILGVNEARIGKPQLVNEDAEGAGWIYKIKLAEPSELDTLLDRKAYLAYVREQG